MPSEPVEVLMYRYREHHEMRLPSGARVDLRRLEDGRVRVTGPVLTLPAEERERVEAEVAAMRGGRE